jgi:hypothetical protein
LFNREIQREKEEEEEEKELEKEEKDDKQREKLEWEAQLDDFEKVYLLIFFISFFRKKEKGK